MSTYGIDESKSRVEVFPATQVYKKTEVYNKSETYAKSEVYNKTEADGKFLTQAAGAPKNHASAANTYGLGTSANFGHVKLTTSMAPPSGDQNGIALAGSMGYTLKKYTDDAIVSYPGNKIPVYGVFICALNVPSNRPDPHNMLGYGTWQFLQKAFWETVDVYWFRRTL
jgi:hypothetical protein